MECISIENISIENEQTISGNGQIVAYRRLTSKPSQPYRGTFKPDLAVFVNLDMLITNLLSFFPAVISLSSTSTSKFEFIECLRVRGTGATGCI